MTHQRTAQNSSPATGVVSAGHPAVAEAGAEALERGGNAIDAAVAAFFTSFHAEPMLASVAGGGFLVAEVDGEAIAYDFFAAAPGLGAGDGPWAPAEADAFWGVEVDFGAAKQIFHIGPGSVAVPGALAGLCQVQRELGKLDLSDVLEPAIRACDGGTTLTNMGAFVFQLLEPIVRSTPEFERYLVRPGGALRQAGEVIVNPELAVFYEALANAGSEDLLYRGDLTSALLEEVRGRGGGLTARDLDEYEVEIEPPVTVLLDDGAWELLLAPPPSSGGMLIGYGMKLMEAVDAPSFSSADEVLLLRAVMAETLRARAEVIGSATPTVEHAAQLLDGGYLERGQQRLRQLLERGAKPLPKIETTDNLAGNTTHVSVIDGEGNACAVTISNGECSGLVLPGNGVFLNNFLGEEDLNPNGFHQFPAGARLGSTMSPTLLRARKGGSGASHGAIAAMGSGGSNRIRTAVLQVLHHLVTHQMSTWDAVQADRVHYENQMLYGESVSTLAESLDQLQERGVRMSRFDVHNMFFGGVHVAELNTAGHLEGVGDARRSGATRLVHHLE